MQTIMQPGEIEAPLGEVPFLFLPRLEDMFATRARRFRALADKHVLGDYLRLMGQLAQGQQEVLDGFPQMEPPGQDYLDNCSRERLPPFGVLGWQRDPAWREGLHRLLANLAAASLPAKAGQAIALLRGKGTEELERYADATLKHDLGEVPVAVAPFVAGALQVYWTALTGALADRDLPRLETADLCPVCGSPPVAALLRSGGKENGLRYLCCSLCSSQYHMVRSICSNCKAHDGLTYYGIEGQEGPVTAESCSKCRTYLKIVRLEKDPEADPLADDLAMLPLDLLMGKEGYDRNGINLMFHTGTA